MKKWNDRKLFSPEGNLLKFSNNQLVDTLNGDCYPVIDDIPVILPEKEKADIQETELHKNLNSNFNYIDHYTKDAEVFDYSEKPNKITAIESMRLHQAIIKEVPKSAKTILDIGCGGAWLARELLKTDNNCNVI